MPLPQPAQIHRKYYTLEEANRALPLVRAIVEDIVRQYRLVAEMKERMAVVSRSSGRASRRRQEPDVYSEEVAHSEAMFEAEQAKLHDYQDELEKLGVELKGPDGLCDFRARRDGRDVYLCWRLGEPEIMYWHELGDGFAGRQPVHEPVRRGAAPRSH
jgi:hypothetical protein